MSRRNTARVVALPVLLTVIAAACGSSAAKQSTATSGAATTAAATASTASAVAAADVNLKGACPDKIVVQTDWFPEAEHGALYEMVGAGYKVDIEKKTVTGPLVAGGKDTGVMIEVRTGGPAIGFSPVTAQMYIDKSITLAYTSHDSAANDYADTPTLSVVAPLEKNPQIVMWDPATYPVKTIKELAAKGARINVFAGGAWMQVFIKEGIVPKGQVDETYDGSPAKFIASGGKIAQQAFATAEPYSYEKEFKEWGKAIAYQTVDDAGFRMYSQPIGIRKGDLETLRPCLKKLVPQIQQATVDNMKSPDRANAIIVDAVAQFKDFWVYSKDIAAFASAKMKADGFVSNGPDQTVGNFDEARVQKTIDQMIAAGITKVPAGLKATDIATNEFIDPKIKL